MTSESSANGGFEKTRLDRIKYHLLRLERENLRTRSQTFDDMVEKLRKMIEEEVKKCY